MTLLPIYQPAGRQQGGREIDSARLAGAVQNVPVEVSPSLAAAETRLATETRPGDLLLIMGAGDVSLLSRALVRRLAAEPLSR